MEEVVQAGGLSILPVFGDIGNHNGAGWHSLVKLSSITLLVVVDLVSKVLSHAGGTDEAEDVGVVGKVQDLLGVGGLVIGGRADADDLTSFEAWELELEGEDVPVVTGGVSDFELIGKFVHLKDGENLSVNIEVLVLVLCLLKSNEVVAGEAIVLSEVG